jgi:uncharacterized protein (TIGR00369 family)
MTAITGTAQPPIETDGPSGFRQLVGFRVDAWRENEAVVSLMVAPRHLNRSGSAHGGAIATLIDAAAGFAGCHTPVAGNIRKAVTLSMSTQFVAPHRSGRLIATGRVTGGGRRIFHVAVDVRDERGRLVATGQCTYRYEKGSEAPEGVPFIRCPEKRGTCMG